MDKETRHALKSDPFAKEVGKAVTYFGLHKKQVVQIGAAALVVILAGAGFWYYRNNRHAERQAALSKALRAQDAPFGTTTAEFKPAFSTEAERDAGAKKSFDALLAKYAASEQAYTAKYILGAKLAEKAQFAEATKLLDEAMKNGDASTKSLAKLSLASVYQAQNKLADAERLLRDLMANPTVMVSKEQATISLAELLKATRPDEARKLLEPLRTDRPAVSRTAIANLSELPPAGPVPAPAAGKK